MNKKRLIKAIKKKLPSKKVHSLISKGNKITQTKAHLKKVNDSGGILNTVITLPTIKLQDQNKVARTNITYALLFLVCI